MSWKPQLLVKGMKYECKWFIIVQSIEHSITLRLSRENVPDLKRSSHLNSSLSCLSVMTTVKWQPGAGISLSKEGGSSSSSLSDVYTAFAYCKEAVRARSISALAAPGLITLLCVLRIHSSHAEEQMNRRIIIVFMEFCYVCAIVVTVVSLPPQPRAPV